MPITRTVVVQQGWHTFVISSGMDKIKNGDPVIYRDQQGTIYGKPRESKAKGMVYTVKVGEEYFKAVAGELTLHQNGQQK